MSDVKTKVDAFFAKSQTWQAELQLLRSIILSCEVEEDFKWFKPCYRALGSNIVGLAALKDSCWVMFFKGQLLTDPKGILLKPGENSQSARVIKFTSCAQIRAQKATLKAYVGEAIAAEKAGLKVQFKQSKNLVYPEELTLALANNAALKQAFESLTPGRQRAYNLHFSQAKQSTTRTARIEKSMAKILAGKGLMDR